MVTEEVDGELGTGGEGGDDVSKAGFWRKGGMKVKSASVGGGDSGAIGKEDVAGSGEGGVVMWM